MLSLVRRQRVGSVFALRRGWYFWLFQDRLPGIRKVLLPDRNEILLLWGSLSCKGKPMALKSHAHLRHAQALEGLSKIGGCRIKVRGKLIRWCAQTDRFFISAKSRVSHGCPRTALESSAELENTQPELEAIGRSAEKLDYAAIGAGKKALE